MNPSFKSESHTMKYLRTAAALAAFVLTASPVVAQVATACDCPHHGHSASSAQACPDKGADNPAPKSAEGHAAHDYSAKKKTPPASPTNVPGENAAAIAIKKAMASVAGMLRSLQGDDHCCEDPACCGKASTAAAEPVCLDADAVAA